METKVGEDFVEVGNRYRINDDRIHAEAVCPNRESFVLLSGSQIAKPLFEPYAIPILRDMSLVDDKGDHFVLTRDCDFYNSTHCACAVTGDRISGRHAWVKMNADFPRG